MEDRDLNFENYAATLQQVIADAIRKAETLQEEAKKEREAAFADTAKRRDLLRKLENEAQRKAEDEMMARYRLLKDEMRNLLVQKMKQAGKTEEAVAEMLKNRI